VTRKNAKREANRLNPSTGCYHSAKRPGGFAIRLWFARQAVLKYLRNKTIFSVQKMSEAKKTVTVS
jgi:hypothetical protein